MHPIFYINGKFLQQKMTGVQRYALEVCLELIKLDPRLKIVVPNNYKNEFPEIEKHLIYNGNRKGVFWEQISLAKFIRKENTTLLNLCNSAPLFYNKNIVTIHDLGVYKEASWYSRKFVFWYKIMTPRIIKKAISILTVSQTIKSEIIERFGISSDVISVVYNGVSMRFGAITEDLEKEKTILHVGSISNRKNIRFLIEAFETADSHDYKLILCGNKDENLITSIQFNDTSKIQWELNCTDEELKALYSKSSYIICASHYEGFGIPVLEGIANFCTPLLSDIPVFKELFSEGALFFDPKNKNDLVKLIEDVTLQPRTLDKAVIANYLTNYTYQSTANIIWELQKIIK